MQFWAEAFVTQGPGFEVLGWMAIFTAFLTAYYTFRVWCRVCAGEVRYEPGDELHDDHGDHHEHGDFHPHAPRFAINLVLVLIAAGALLAAVPYFMGNSVEDVGGGWVADMVNDSTAAAGLPGHPEHPGSLAGHGAEAHHGSILGMDPHVAMYWISGVVGGIGLFLAFWLHLWRRQDADRLRNWLLSRGVTRWLPVAMENKWYVDEVYHVFIRAPLWLLGHLLYAIDRYIIDGLLVDGTAQLPRLLARWFQPLSNGMLQSYAVTMAGGAVLIALLMLLLMQFFSGGVVS